MEVILKTEWYPLIKPLSNEEAGKIMKAMLEYQSGFVTDIDIPIWEFFKTSIDKDNQERASISEKRREAVMQRWTPGRFIVPSVTEIQEYITDKGYKVDACSFFDFYQSKGWMVGKNKMKDWKAAVRTWARGTTHAIKKREAF